MERRPRYLSAAIRSRQLASEGGLSYSCVGLLSRSAQQSALVCCTVPARVPHPRVWVRQVCVCMCMAGMRTALGGVTVLGHHPRLPVRYSRPGYTLRKHTGMGLCGTIGWNGREGGQC